jgi:hypothetical protein
MFAFGLILHIQLIHMWTSYWNQQLSARMIAPIQFQHEKIVRFQCNEILSWTTNKSCSPWNMEPVIAILYLRCNLTERGLMRASDFCRHSVCFQRMWITEHIIGSGGYRRILIKKSMEYRINLKSLVLAVHRRCDALSLFAPYKPSEGQILFGIFDAR